jgi:phosphoglycolate phosphatase-like HAD superfamily hydrolase
MLLAWDIDGTLIHSGADRSASVFPGALQKVLGAPCTLQISMAGKTDAQIVTEMLLLEGAPPDLCGAVLAAADELTLNPTSPQSLNAVAGVATALTSTYLAGHTNVLLTGNTPTRARAKLSRAGYDLSIIDWGHSQFGDRATERADLAHALASAATQLGRIPLIIGDTPLDALAAYEANVLFCGVATGVYTAKDLASTTNILVIENFVVESQRFMTLLEDLTC